MPLIFTMPIDPKSVMKDFLYKKLIIFNSAKVPLMITARNQ
jgi:hypothetical protein